MTSKKICFVRALLASIVLFALGCSHTALSPNAFSKPTFEEQGLSALPSVSICLRNVPATLGHQFGLLVFPLGIIDGGIESEHRLFSELAINAARRGIALKLSCESPRLFFDVVKLDVSANDALFIRYVSARISANLVDTSTNQFIPLEGRASSWRRFGYRAQLDAIFHDAANAAFQKVPFEKFRTLR